MNKFARVVRRNARGVVVGLGSTVGVVGSAMADPAADALAALGSLTTGQAAFATPLFALAIATVGIMIGVKWIKRGRSAA